MKDNHPIDNLFKDKLASAKTTPSIGAWDEIATNLNTGKSRKDIYFFVAVAASVSLLCAFTWTTLNKTSEETPFELAKISKIQPDFEVNIQKSQVLRVEISQAPIRKISTHLMVEEGQSTITQNIEQFSVGIQPLQRRNISLNNNDYSFNAADLKFELPAFITDPEAFQAPRGVKFSFIRSLASVAKGVNEGQRALSGIRKSKIEFINEELKLDDPEKKSKVEATLQDDSPSNQQ